jgi:hypothetical protein
LEFFLAHNSRWIGTDTFGTLYRLYTNSKTGLKISKGVDKTVNRRTDNTMSVSSTKYTEKIEEQEPNWKPGGTSDG